MKDPREIIIRPIITENTYDMMEEGRQAIEALFNVHVTKVNTLNVKSKPKRLRQQPGRTRTWKKAMVTLAEGETIELFATQQ